MVCREGSVLQVRCRGAGPKRVQWGRQPAWHQSLSDVQMSDADASCGEQRSCTERARCSSASRARCLLLHQRSRVVSHARECIAPPPIVVPAPSVEHSAPPPGLLAAPARFVEDSTQRKPFVGFRRQSWSASSQLGHCAQHLHQSQLRAQPWRLW